MTRRFAIAVLLLSFGTALAQTAPPGKRVNVQCMERPGMEQSLDRFEKAFQRIRSRKPADDPKADELHKSYRFYARIHNGPPGDKAWCNHMNELFLTWHRAALRIFELALQAADKENGGDGSIMLPYWNWTEQPTGTFYPKPFERDAPLQPAGDPRRTDPRRNPRYTAAEVQEKIDHAPTWRKLGGAPCIDPDCAQPAPDPCPDCGEGGAIEQPFHNEMHGWIGGDMNEDISAATDPLFWSFHAYIDLLFDQWQRDNGYPQPGCLECAFRGMTGWTPKRIEHTENIGYMYDTTTCAPAPASGSKLAMAVKAAPRAAAFEVAHNQRSAAEGPFVFDVVPPSSYFRTAGIELAGAEQPSDFSYSGEVFLYPAATKLELDSSAFRKRWRVGDFAVWALHHGQGHGHAGHADLFVDATTELEYIRKHQPGSKWKVAIVVEEVRPAKGHADAKSLRSRISFSDVKIAVDRGSEASK